VWVHAGVVVISSDEMLPEGTHVRAGETVTLSAQTAVLLRQA
jgi:hypothetical protein